MQPLASFLVRLLTCIGDVYYLLLVPLLCLYLAIFVSNKFQSHQQQRQQQHITRQESPHRRRSSAAQQDETPVISLPSPPSALTSSSSSSSFVDSAFVDSSPSSPVVSAPSSPSSPTASSLLNSPSSSSSSLLTLTFLLPDQSLVSHSFPATAAISAVLATLYPPPSPLTASARLIYQGRLLHSTSLLSQHHMSSDDMVHVHLLHASHSGSEGAAAAAVRGIAGGTGWVGGGVGEPPAVLVCLLSVLCAALGCGWGVFLVCGAVVFDVSSTCVLLSGSGATAVLLMYAHACAARSQRPVVVPM